MAEHYQTKNVKMIYVNVDDRLSSDAIKRFIIQRGIKLPMMLPNQKEAMEKYQVYSLPQMVILGKEGRIQKIISGFNEDLETELSQVIDGLLEA